MREAAQTHYQSGARFFESGQYDAALVEFEAAWRLSGEPDLLHIVSPSSGYLRLCFLFALPRIGGRWFWPKIPRLGGPVFGLLTGGKLPP